MGEEEVVVRVRSAETEADGDVEPAPWPARPIISGPTPSSQCAISRSPVSSGRSPRLSMNADTLTLACASSPAKSTSSGRPRARTWAKTVLNAFTTCALAGTALAISSAPEEPSGVTSPVASALKVLEMSMMILPPSASPYCATTGTALAYGTARMTMSPPGAMPNVPAVAPPPSASAMSLDLAASRPMTSTALPPSTARAPMARA